MSGWIQEVSRLSQERRDYVLITLTGIRGSAPQVVGAKMLVTSDGLHSGTVGGGKIEAYCIRFAQELLKTSGETQSRTWNLQKDIGMSCGGEVSLFFDCYFQGKWTVAVFGAGHVAQELCRVMQTWSCQLKVFDPRADWLEKLPSSPNIDKHLSTDSAADVASLPAGTFLVSMTQGHALDVPILAEALRRVDHFKFVGVIGSAVKGEKIRRELRALSITEAAIARLVCPAGLPIGDNTPPEISISIAAQILSLREKK